MSYYVIEALHPCIRLLTRRDVTARSHAKSRSTPDADSASTKSNGRGNFEKGIVAGIDPTTSSLMAGLIGTNKSSSSGSQASSGYDGSLKTGFTWAMGFFRPGMRDYFRLLFIYNSLLAS